MGATAERVAAFKAEQASKEVLQKEMAYMYKKPPTPATPVPAGRGANFAAAAHQIRGVYNARGGKGKSRGKYRTYNRPQYQNQQQESKASGAKDSTDDKTAKPNAPNKK